MNTRFLLILTLIALLTVPGLATAQEAATPTATEEPADRAEPDGAADLEAELREADRCPDPEAIDAHTVLCSAELKDGTAVLVLRSDKLQRITLTDAGAFMEGGEVPQQRATLRAEETNTVRMKVTEHRGFAGVTVTTRGVLYAVPLEEPTVLVGPPWSARDVQIAALTTALSVGSVSVVLVFRAVTGRRSKPERVA